MMKLFWSFFIVLSLFFTPVLAAPAPVLTREEGRASRQVLELDSLEGQYILYVLGDGETFLGNQYPWQSDPYQKNWQGKYLLYLRRSGQATAALQDFPARQLVINASFPHFNGFYVVRDYRRQQPDLLLCAQRTTARGEFSLTAYLIRAGKLCQLTFQEKNGQRSLIHAGSLVACSYLKDGRLLIPWRDANGNFLSSYRLDCTNSLLIAATTWQPQRKTGEEGLPPNYNGWLTDPLSHQPSLQPLPQLRT